MSFYLSCSQGIDDRLALPRKQWLSWSYGTIFALVGIRLSSQALFNCKLHLKKKEFKFCCHLLEAYYILCLYWSIKAPQDIQFSLLLLY